MIEEVNIENLIYEVREKQVMLDSKIYTTNVIIIFMTR